MSDDFDFDSDIGSDDADTYSSVLNQPDLSWANTPTTASSGSGSTLSSGQSDGSSALGALAQAFGGGTATLGDNTSGSPTGSGALALTNGGGSTGATPGGTGYTLDDNAGITHDLGTAAAPQKTLLQQIASTVQDKDGNLDLSKLIKVGTGLGGVFEAYQKNKAAAAAKAAQLQAAAVAPVTAQTFSAPQQASVSGYFNGTQNRAPLYPSANGISSIVPASVTRPQVGYASGGGIGALGDDRYGSSAASPAAPADDIYTHILQNLLTGNLKTNEKKAGVSDPDPTTMQAGTARRVPDSGQGLVPVTDLLRSIPLLLKGVGYDPDTDPDPYAGGAGSGYAPNAPQLRGMADGGGVVASNPDMGALAATAPGAMSHGTYGLISGPGDGQSDSIPINAAAGEYMMDAETVSMLGNGDNAAGAQALDAWREALRQHKRAAPPDQIAPPTGPQQMPPMGAQ